MQNQGIMYVKLGPYLQELAIQEQSKPENMRRPVPTLEHIAKSVGVSATSLYNLSGGKTRSLKFDLGSAIIDEVRRWGFEMQMTDLITYIPEKNNN